MLNAATVLKTVSKVFSSSKPEVHRQLSAERVPASMIVMIIVRLMTSVCGERPNEKHIRNRVNSFCDERFTADFQMMAGIVKTFL